MDNFGAWLRRHRNELGLLQSEVARRAGVSTSYISTLERGQKHSTTGASLVPERDKVIAIAKAVKGDVDTALLLFGYAPKEAVEAQGFFSGYYDLPPDRQELARRQIKGILDSLAEGTHDTNYIDDE